MKIAYIINARLPTELAHGHQTARMCAAFAETGTDVILLYPRRRQTPAIGGRDIFDYYGIPRVFEARALWNIDTVYWFEARLPRFCAIWIHAAHSVLWGSYAAWVARRAGFRVYYTRDMIIAWWLTVGGFPLVYEYHALPTRRAGWLLRTLGKSKSLLLTITVTSFIKRQLADRGFNPDKIVTLPDAVDLSLFSALPERAVCRKKLGLPHTGFLIGYVGRFRVFGMEEKGIFGLIEAVAILARDYAVVLLLVGGPSEMVAAYTDYARARGLSSERVYIVGQVSPRDVPQWMRACDAVVIPWHFTQFSAYATSPLKLFEYMASGTPLVASDLPSLREIVNDASAVLVRAGSAHALADGIARVLKDPDLGTRIAAQARKDVESYTWKKRAEDILRILQ